MKQAFFIVVAMSAASLCGCRLYSKMPHHGGCQQGCEHGCGSGCEHGCGSGCESCAGPHCGDGIDGHPDPYELMHPGHQGPPERGGVLGLLGRKGPPRGAAPAPGPSAGNVSYPYYTNRGPRDFLAPNPRGIGP